VLATYVCALGEDLWEVQQHQISSPDKAADSGDRSQMSWSPPSLSRVADRASSARSSQVKALPAVYPVNSCPVRVVDGVVEIDLGVQTRELEIG
jgi:hypothetical protein